MSLKKLVYFKGATAMTKFKEADNRAAILKLQLPQYKWMFRLGDMCVPCSSAPNWFHRKMQRWLLGISWTEMDRKGE